MSEWVDIKAIRGDTLHLHFPFTDCSGGAYNLTGYKSILTIKKFIDDESDDINAVYQEEKSSISIPELGIIDYYILSQYVNDLSGKYFFDFKLIVIATGEAMTPYIGSMNFVRNITRGY